MQFATRVLWCAAFTLAVGVNTARAQSLTTTFANNNAHYGAMFNISAKVDLTVDAFDVHFQDLNNPAPCAMSCSVVEVEVYHVTGGGGFKPVADDPSAWTLLGSVQHTVTTAQGVPQPLSFPLGLAMSPSGIVKYGWYVTSTGPTNSTTGLANEFQHYTNGSGLTYQNGEMLIPEGYGLDYPFGNIFTPRTWNGTVHYTAVPTCGASITYCSPGASASGCQATLSSSGTASLTAGSGFTLSATGVEGNRSGQFFMGLSGRQASPWGNGTSLLCVVPPLVRLGLLPSTGTSGACDGAFSQDLNSQWCPTCPNHPSVGTLVQAQLWYRDSANTSNQKTGLSDAIEFLICP